jgi:hypothetical protein
MLRKTCAAQELREKPVSGTNAAGRKRRKRWWRRCAQNRRHGSRFAASFIERDAR